MRFKNEMISIACELELNGDVGESTKKEIEYARSLNKEILSLEPLC